MNLLRHIKEDVHFEMFKLFIIIHVLMLMFSESYLMYINSIKINKKKCTIINFLFSFKTILF